MPLKSGRELTDNNDVGVHRKSAAPGDGAEVGPLVVHRARSAGKELVQNPEDDEAYNLSEDTGGDGKTLHDEV